jgi:predicted phosphate transport protein (TIGR00153 family)
MNWVKGFFKPRQNSFVQLLTEQAQWTVQGIEGLEKYMKKRSPKHAEQVTVAEKEADEVRRILIDELNRTFVTPMDREDIHALSRSIDDVLDYAYTTIGEMEILEVEPNDYLRRIASLLGDAAREILLAVQRLGDHPNVANDHAVRAKALENRVEQVYREAVADLFHQPQDVEHIVDMLKLREIYRHLSNAADRGDEAANVISDIVVKMT